jgi:type II secretory pathway pseudopilin PulG
LLELIVVIVILGILAALAIPTFNRVVNGSKERVEQAEMSAILRDAQALARLDNRTIPTQADVETALDEAEAAGAGTQAAAVGRFDVVPQTSWPTEPEVGTTAFVYGTDGSTVGVAHASLRVSGRCILGTVAAGGKVHAWVTSAPVVDCDSNLALDGDTAADTPIAVGPAPFSIAGFSFQPGSDPTDMGAIDDYKAVIDGVTVANDNFNRADGPLTAGPQGPYVDPTPYGYLPAQITGGQAEAANLTTPNITSPAGDPDARSWRTELTVTRMPATPAAPTPTTASLSLWAGTPSHTYSAGIEHDGTLHLGVRTQPGIEQQWRALDPGTIDVGDRIVLRVTPTTVTVHVNGNLLLGPYKPLTAPALISGTVSSAAPGFDPTDCTIHVRQPATTGWSDGWDLNWNQHAPVAADGTFAIEVLAEAPRLLRAECPEDSATTGDSATYTLQAGQLQAGATIVIP